MVFRIKKTKNGRFLVFEKSSNGDSNLRANKGSRKEAQSWIRGQ